jgi:hypothetical protein
VLDAASTVVATGTVAGAEVSVPAGIYRIEVGATDSRVFEGVVVDAEEARNLDVTP